MREFTDCLGRVWKLALDPWILGKIDAEADVLLTKWGDDNFKLAVELSQDLPKLCTVLWGFCEEQTQANGVTNEREFARGMGDDTLLHAYTALAGAVTDFSTSPEQREAMRLAMEKGQEVERLTNEMLLARVKERIEKINPLQEARNYIDSVSNGQASSESTPSPEDLPSASSV